MDLCAQQHTVLSPVGSGILTQRSSGRRTHNITPSHLFTLQSTIPSHTAYLSHISGFLACEGTFDMA